ncbi:DUF2948 family protein [Hyphococcus flavus]|uniref:DUF2948 family protein n=1 Tax=Hyphococcus flavus TaxID=1866326 RepID=A0AAE9ZBQ6_9PROT|nr:DUF2948 family protein [Hyphococcus flavus]WDI31216.1 DUF2948 family protein [Hyphococcus flavus]
MASLKDYKPLKLMAGDEEDLGVISACLQDAVAKLGDFAFLPDERRFALVANRFVWEIAVDRRSGPFVRVRSGLHFDDVKSAQFQHLRTNAKDAVVELLSIRFEKGEDGAGVIMFDFAGGGAVRLEVESVNAYMSDISDPWRTRAKPKHDE